MNANELAYVMEKYSVAGFQYPLCDEFKQAATMLRQQQSEIDALKKRCLDEIFKTTYADQNTKVMERYWQEAQAEIDHLKRCIHDAIAWLDIKQKSKDAEIAIEILSAKEEK
jgi:uncharacterized LabA/DUF88 family protein